MSEDMLTQEEIDALLDGIAEDEQTGGDAEVLQSVAAVVLDAAAAALELSGGDEEPTAEPEGAPERARQGEETTAVDYVIDGDDGCILRLVVAGSPQREAARQVGSVEAALIKAAPAVQQVLADLVDTPVDVTGRAAGETSAPAAASFARQAETADGGVFVGIHRQAADHVMDLLADDDQDPVAAPEAEATEQAFDPPQLGSNGAPEGADRPMNLLLDVPLEVTVQLGETQRQIKDILALGPGSVVELDKLAGEPVDVLVNGRLIAQGEVVVIDESFGVRISDIISRADRISQLQ